MYRDILGGHCQGACHPQWFFYIPFNVSDTAPPFTWSCEPWEMHTISKVEGREINLHKPLPRMMGMNPRPLHDRHAHYHLHYCSLHDTTYGTQLYTNPAGGLCIHCQQTLCMPYRYMEAKCLWRLHAQELWEPYGYGYGHFMHTGIWRPSFKAWPHHSGNDNYACNDTYVYPCTDK